jgi:hypothetical protein
MKNVLLAILWSSAIATIGVAEEPKLPNCFEAWKGNVPIGHKCGDAVASYEKVDRPGFGIAWKDLQSGLIWSEIQTFSVTSGSNYYVHFDDAWNHCEAMNAHLPMPEECAALHAKRPHFPIKLPRHFWSSRLDDLWGSTIELSARYCSGVHPEYSDSRNSNGNYGGWDRRYKTDISTVCVDDSQVVNNPQRPVKPAPVEKIEY